MGTSAGGDTNAEGALDRKLPPGTIRRDGRVKSAFYDIDDKKIYAPKKVSSRSLRHEKAHFIWQNRMTPAQRKEFNTEARKHAKEIIGKDIPMGRVQKQGGTVGEELFAITYAGHKEGREFAKPMKKIFERMLKK